MIRRWTLTRRSNQNVAHIFIQDGRPTDEYISAFGRPEEFELTQSSLAPGEIIQERDDRRRREYPDFNSLLLAVYFKEKGNAIPMNTLVELIDAIHDAHR
jgi:hypothetical protein